MALSGGNKLSGRNKLTTEEKLIHDEYTKYRDIIRKRVNRLKEAGMLKESALQRYENGIPKARDLTLSQMKRELDIAKRTLAYKKTASLSGLREVKKRQELAIKEEGERLKERIKAERGEDEDLDEDLDEMLEKVQKYSYNMMSFLRSLHLDLFMYKAKGAGQAGFDTMQDELIKWGGMKGKNYWQATANILSQELDSYDAGKLINEEMAKSHKNKKKIKELADALNAELELDKQKRYLKVPRRKRGK